jgi:hypothetical protein
MVQSDALSQREDFNTGDTDNEDMTMLPKSLFINSIDIELHDLLAESIMKDDLVINALKAIKHGGTPPMKSSIADWKTEDGLLFFRDRCYVPQDVKLRKETVK